MVHVRKTLKGCVIHILNNAEARYLERLGARLVAIYEPFDFQSPCEFDFEVTPEILKAFMKKSRQGFDG